MADKLITTIDAGSSPVYEFIDRDERTIILRDVQDHARYVTIDKQALGMFATTFQDLARQFTK